jgi:hypothetical protein
LHIAASDNNPDTVTHEGLHSVWTKLNPQQKSQFLSIAQGSVGSINQPETLGTPIPLEQMQLGKKYNIINGKNYDPANIHQQSTGAADYINSGLNNKQLYPSYSGLQSLNNLSALPDDIQTEVHSYLPNYYAAKHQVMPANLAQYYGQYFNPGAVSPGTPNTQPLNWNVLPQQNLPRPISSLNQLIKRQGSF